MFLNKDSGVKQSRNNYEPNKIKLFRLKVSFYLAQRMYFAALKKRESTENLY